MIEVRLLSFVEARLLSMVEVWLLSFVEVRCSKMAYRYILRCSDGSYYIGSTKNLEQRLWQHQNGQGANYTKLRLPVKLICVEYYERVEEAFAREKQIQKWSRKKKEALIKGDFAKLHSLSLSKDRSLSLSKGEPS